MQFRKRLFSVPLFTFFFTLAVTGLFLFTTAFSPVFLLQLSTTPSFSETFDGSPATPTSWSSPNWDSVIHSRDTDTWTTLQEMDAQHGSHCEAPLMDTTMPMSMTNPLVTHHLTGIYPTSVFQCRNHLMTAIKADGYGMIVLTPNVVADFSTQEAVIKWDMSTLRTSTRDWIDVVITNYDDNLAAPLHEWLPDMRGMPKNALQFELNSDNSFVLNEYRNGVQQNTPVSATGFERNWQGTGYETVITPDPAKRDTFEIRISKTRVKIGMPNVTYTENGETKTGYVWIDKDIAPLGWSKGVVQFIHHSYTPEKDCDVANNAGPDGKCIANTWHWDNVSISPAEPFTIIHTDTSVLTNESTSRTVHFDTPAPENSMLRFLGVSGEQIEVSFDGGSTWEIAKVGSQQKPCCNEAASNYWTPIPAGVQDVTFKAVGSWWGSHWMIRDFAIWSKTTGIVSPTPTLSPADPTPTQIEPTPTSVVPTTTPISTPMPTMTPTPTPQPTATPTPKVLGSTITIYTAGSTVRSIKPKLVLQVKNANNVWKNVKSMNVGGNIQTRTFETYTYTATKPILPSHIRLAFTNDYHNARTKEDRNVMVDKIVLDGVPYETEALSVYAKGSGMPLLGCGTGFNASEILNCNGYFEYK